MAEGLSASEVGKEIAEHGKESGNKTHRWLSIAEAVLLSVVALIAAYSGYAAAKWGTERSIALAHAATDRTEANRADLTALQIRTLDSVSFNAVFPTMVSGDKDAYRVAVKRLRPGYKPAFNAWVATKPLTNPNAPPGPSYMPQYKIPQAAQAKDFDAKADHAFAEGEYSGATADKYVRITVFLATVLFLVGISSHFPVKGGRYALVGTGVVLLVYSIVQLLGLPGIPGSSLL
jgi:hypothetical protein